MAQSSATITFGDKNRGFQAGIINGSVTVESHPPPEQIETPPKPSAVVPFSRDVDFVQRGELFGLIQQKCAAPGSRTALVGLGGVGKSQLAIEFAYRIRERSPETWVFWVYARNAARLEQSYRDIANYVKAPGRQNPNADIFQLVHNWLWDETKGKWVLILDNVDDAGFLLESRNGRTKPLISYIPRCQNGSVLITTRSKNAALELVEQRDIITVEPMDKKDAQALMRKKLGQQDSGKEDIGDIIKLAAALEFMPLAIVQAAAYIFQRLPRCSVQQYLQDFQRNDRKRATLLKHKGGQLRRDREAENSIIVTWQISFDHIYLIRPSAADLLALMSCYDRQGIPEALFRHQTKEEVARQDQEERDNDFNDWREEEDNTSQSSASDEFEDDVMTLRDYSFISANADGATFEMHGLVQLATRKWLELHGRLERWQKESLRTMAKAFPNGQPGTWAECHALLSHAREALTYILRETEPTQNWATIATKTAWYLLHMGDFTASEKLSRHALEEWKNIRGPVHKDTLNSVSQLGSVLIRQGKYKDAETLHRQALEEREKVLGPKHPATLTSLSYCGSALERQGKLEMAEAIHRRALEAREKVLGPEHANTLTSASLLGQVLLGQDKYEEAEVLHRRTLQRRENVLGLQHPRTLDSASFLARVLLRRGKYGAAEEMNRRALEGREKVLANKHPDTLSSVYCLAMLFHEQRQYNIASTLYERASSGYQRVLGLEHPTAVACSQHYSSLLQEMQQKMQQGGQELLRGDM